jgi:methyl-accepting chemotaxis protein
LSGISVIATLLIAVILFAVMQKQFKALSDVGNAMHEIAGGHLKTTVPCLDRTDEIGDMANHLDLFRAALIRERDSADHQKAEQTSKEKAAHSQTRLVEMFNTKLAQILGAIVSSANQLEGNAQTMSQVSERTGQQTSAVASASQQAAANVQTVATASEELVASSLEIAAQVGRASTIAQNAAAKAEATNQLVGGLADSATKIGEVISLINDIASQTNLLALNATIEAARAGEAGKGFAIVANEVKNLANQTARATGEIASQISTVQNQTAQAVDAIRSIALTIQEMDEASGAIAAAIDEQGAATQEITRNIQEAHTGTAEVARNIVGVRDGAEDNSKAAHDIHLAASRLTGEAGSMQALADTFVIRLKSASDTLE